MTNEEITNAAMKLMSEELISWEDALKQILREEGIEQ